MTIQKNTASEGDNLKTREALCQGLTELIRTHSDELTRLGFAAELARFDCLFTVKMIVDDLYDKFDVGNARRDWYREYFGLCYKQ